MPEEERWRRSESKAKPARTLSLRSSWLFAISPHTALCGGACIGVAVFLLGMAPGAGAVDSDDSDDNDKYKPKVVDELRRMIENNEVNMTGPYTPEQTAKIQNLLAKDPIFSRWVELQAAELLRTGKTTAEDLNKLELLKSYKEYIDSRRMKVAPTTMEPRLDKFRNRMDRVNAIFRDAMQPMQVPLTPGPAPDTTRFTRLPSTPASASVRADLSLKKQKSSENVDSIPYTSNVFSNEDSLLASKSLKSETDASSSSSLSKPSSSSSLSKSSLSSSLSKSSLSSSLSKSSSSSSSSSSSASSSSSS